ncbi:MAG TPA: hypothetical protein VK639_03385 [Terriglobales bacterium]|nr:hypothetical protein [Terriglobales bacterium]
MQAVVLLGAVILVGFVIVDWRAFTRISHTALGYGLAIARRQERLRLTPCDFGADGRLRLEHGMAQHYPDHHAIMLLPELKRFGISFRTAWPLNGVVYYDSLKDNSEIRLVKRIPWSSAVLTFLWFLTVAGGLIAYFVFYAQAGGFASASGTFLAAALGGLGLLVFLFGLIVVVAAYWLEDKRLMVVYHELRSALGAPHIE